MSEVDQIFWHQTSIRWISQVVNHDSVGSKKCLEKKNLGDPNIENSWSCSSVHALPAFRILKRIKKTF